MKKKNWNGQVLAELVCYLLFGGTILYLILSNRYLSYVTPKMKPYLYFTAAVMLIWTGVSLTGLFRIQRRKRTAHCLVLIIPVLLLLMPHGGITAANLSGAAGLLTSNAANSVGSALGNGGGAAGSLHDSQSTPSTVGDPSGTYQSQDTSQDDGAGDIPDPSGASQGSGASSSAQSAKSSSASGSAQSAKSSGTSGGAQSAKGSDASGGAQSSKGSGASGGAQSSKGSGTSGGAQSAKNPDGSASSQSSDPSGGSQATAAQPDLPDVYMTTDPYTQPKQLHGYDAKNKTIAVSNDEYYDWVNEFFNNFDQLKGFKVTITGAVYKDDPTLEKNQFVPIRLVMTCCVADLTPMGLVCTYDKTPQLKSDQWVTVTGTLYQGKYKGQTEPRLMVTSVKAAKPVPGYIYPYA